MTIHWVTKLPEVIVVNHSPSVSFYLRKVMCRLLNGSVVQARN